MEVPERFVEYSKNYMQSILTQLPIVGIMNKVKKIFNGTAAVLKHMLNGNG